MLFLVVAVLLVLREYGQGDVVGLDDLVHELTVVLGITIIFGVVKINGVFDVADRYLADDSDISVAG